MMNWAISRAAARGGWNIKIDQSDRRLARRKCCNIEPEFPEKRNKDSLQALNEAESLDAVLKVFHSLNNPLIMSN